MSTLLRTNLRASSITAWVMRLTLPCAVMGTTVLGVPSAAHGAVARATSKVSCAGVLFTAAKTGDGTIPAELKFIESQLRDDQFAAYKSFKFLERRSLEITEDHGGSVAFRTGHRLDLQLLGVSGDRLRLRLALLAADGKRSLVATDYSIRSGGVFLVGGTAHEGARLFMALVCAHGGTVP